MSLFRSDLRGSAGANSFRPKYMNLASATNGEGERSEGGDSRPMDP
jgi:hypothetical protein